MQQALACLLMSYFFESIKLVELVGKVRLMLLPAFGVGV